MQFLIMNGASAAAAAPVKVATGAAIKTMLQVLPLTIMRVVEWGCSFDASAAATPGEVELITTGTVAATVTAAVANDITPYDMEAVQFNNAAFFMTLSTTGTGYTATAEGTVVAPVKNLAGPQLIAPTNQFIEQFPLGYRPAVKASDLLRIRMTFGTTTNAYCYVIVEF